MTDVSVVLFEDDRVGGFGPPVWTRPAFELRVGCLNLRERLERALPEAPRSARVRPELRELLEATLPDWARAVTTPRVLALNARAHGSVDALRSLAGATASGRGAVLLDAGLLCAWGETSWVEETLASPSQAGSSSFDGVILLAAPWDVVSANDEAIASDAAQLRGANAHDARIFGVQFEDDDHSAVLAKQSYADADLGSFYPGVNMVAADRILVGRDVRVKPGVVLDASEGPIVLANGVRVEANATIVGPAYVGPGSVVNPGAKLREGTSLGAFCKVGGEIEESVMLDLSNKQHDGFLGHALVGSWVNLGADTNASDLKNNYGTVRVDLGEGEFDSGSRFVGPTIGDHTKTGINTMLNTGCVIGVGANVFGGGFPPKTIPAFSWGGMDDSSRTRLDAALETMRVVLSRRAVRWDEAYEKLMRSLYER